MREKRDEVSGFSGFNTILENKKNAKERAEKDASRTRNRAVNARNARADTFYAAFERFRVHSSPPKNDKLHLSRKKLTRANIEEGPESSIPHAHTTSG